MSHLDDHHLDQALRRDLTASPEMSERIIRKALAAESVPVSRARWRPAAVWPWLAAAAALAIILAQLPRDGDARIPTFQPSAQQYEPTRLRISNESGPIVVTSTSGSRLILLTTNGATP